MDRESILAPVEDADGQKEVVEPKKNNYVYTAFLLGGMAFPLPTYAIITCVDFYQDRYPHSTILMDLLGVRLACLIIGYFINNAILEVFNLTQRIMFTYVIFVLALMFLTIFDLSLGLFGDTVSYFVTLTVNGIVCLMYATQQSSYYGYASMLPQRYMQAVTVGESFCGIQSCLLRFVTKAIVSDLQSSTALFYITGIAIVFICSIIFFMTRKTTFVQLYVRRCLEKHSDPRTVSSSYQALVPHQAPQDRLDHWSEHNAGYQTDALTSEECPVHADQRVVERSATGGITQPHLRPAASLATDSSVRGDQYWAITGDNSRSVCENECNVSPLLARESSLKARMFVRLQRRWSVIKLIAKPMLSLAFTMTVSMSIFSIGVPYLVSCPLGSWMPIIIILLVDVGDTAGKIMVSRKWVRQSVSRVLVLGSLLRLAFYPLVLLCCLPRPLPIISWEGWAFLIMLANGFTNGLLQATALTIAPSYVSVGDRELCGNTMMMASMLMMLSGLGLAYFLAYVLALEGDEDVCGTVGINVTMTSVGQSGLT